MTTDLSLLINSLSGPEKRFVRLELGEKKNSARTRLLNVLWKDEELTDAKIAAAIGGKTGKHQPHVVCHQLFRSILQALRKFHSDQEEFSLQNGIQEADLLHKRALYKPALKRLQELLKQSEESQRHLLSMEILNRIMELNQVMGKQIPAKEMTALFTKERQWLRDFSDIVKVKQDSGHLFFEMRRSGQAGRAQQKEWLEKALLDPFYSDESKITSFRSGVGFFQLHAAAHQLNGELMKALSYHQKLVVFLERHRTQISKRPLFYLAAINNLALAYGSMNEPVEVIQCVQKLREAPALFGFKNTRDWQTRIFTTLYPILHSLYIQQGLFSRAEKIIQDTEGSLSELGKGINPFHQQLIRYNLAYLYFGRKEFRSCLRELQYLLKKEDSAVRLDLFQNARLMKLLVYYEQKEEEAFLYESINFKRFLKKKDPGDRSIHIVLSFLKKELRFSDNTINDWNTLRATITPLWKSSKSSETFDLVRWLSTFSV